MMMQRSEGLDQLTAVEKWYQKQRLAYQAEQPEAVPSKIAASRLSTEEKIERKQQVKLVIRRLRML